MDVKFARVARSLSLKMEASWFVSCTQFPLLACVFAIDGMHPRGPISNITIFLAPKLYNLCTLQKLRSINSARANDYYMVNIMVMKERTNEIDDRMMMIRSIVNIPQTGEKERSSRVVQTVEEGSVCLYHIMWVEGSY